MRGYIVDNILHPLEAVQPPYKICWHLRDFIPGMSINEQISSAVSNSRKVLFIFSEHFEESDFCRFELELAMARQLSTNTRCVLPLTVGSDCVPNCVKASITYMPVCEISLNNGQLLGGQLLKKLIKIIGKRLKNVKIIILIIVLISSLGNPLSMAETNL